MYKTSTDYGRLWELAQDEQIVWRNKLVSSAGEWSSTPKNIKAWAGDKTKFFRYCAEFGIEFIDPASQQKTPAELAAGEMADVLQWALDAMPPSMLDYYYCKELVKKAEELLKKARGEE